MVDTPRSGSSSSVEVSFNPSFSPGGLSDSDSLINDTIMEALNVSPVSELSGFEAIAEVIVDNYDSNPAASIGQIIPSNPAGVQRDFFADNFGSANHEYLEDLAKNAAPNIQQFNQTVASDTWTFTHNLGREPLGVEVYVGGCSVIANVVHLDANNIQISFNQPQIGTVVFL